MAQLEDITCGILRKHGVVSGAGRDAVAAKAIKECGKQERADMFGASMNSVMSLPKWLSSRAEPAARYAIVHIAG